MTNKSLVGLSRRDFLQSSLLGGAGLTLASLAGCSHSGKADLAPTPAQTSATTGNATTDNPYTNLLKTWCDALLALQVNEIKSPGIHGGIICPACSTIHGRCADAAYPLMHMAHVSGDRKYLDAAIRLQAWADHVARPDGSWVNMPTTNDWKGITVFGSIALAESLHFHGGLLDEATRKTWTDRLARAAKYIDENITPETGNINYPVTAALSMAVCGEVLHNEHYTRRARDYARAALEHFTPNNLLYGEGKPKDRISAKNCRPVDLGYNVEESLPALAMYSLITGDAEVREKTVAAMRAHMEFMLPCGAWDNSWGTRNNKWTWWGSRTSDGCQTAYVLLAGHDKRFLDVAWRNLQLMQSCTHNGLLYGGPDLQAHGDLPCVHHTFTHAKALAAVLDRTPKGTVLQSKAELPRDQAYGVKHFPEIGTYLVGVGEWQATVTEYDWEYVKGGGGHATGGAMSMLYHRRLGPIVSASMTEYQMVEPHNMQTHRDLPSMCLTPRVELAEGKETYTSISDEKAVLTMEKTAASAVFTATGNLLNIGLKGPKGATYRVTYQFQDGVVKITARAEAGEKTPQFILPVLCRHDEKVTIQNASACRVQKSAGTVTVSTNAPGGFLPLPSEQFRVFNLVPGFEALPLKVNLPAGKTVEIQIRAE